MFGHERRVVAKGDLVKWYYIRNWQGCNRRLVLAGEEVKAWLT